MRNHVLAEDIIVVPEGLLRRFRKEHGFVASGTETEKAYTLKTVNKEKHEDDDHSRSEEIFDDKEAALFPSETKQHAQFHRIVMFEWMRSKTVPLDFSDKIEELQFISLSTYLRACVTPKDHRTNVDLSAAHAKYHGSVV